MHATDFLSEDYWREIKIAFARSCVRERCAWDKNVILAYIFISAEEIIAEFFGTLLLAPFFLYIYASMYLLIIIYTNNIATVYYFVSFFLHQI